MKTLVTKAKKGFKISDSRTHNKEIQPTVVVHKSPKICCRPSLGPKGGKGRLWNNLSLTLCTYRNWGFLGFNSKNWFTRTSSGTTRKGFCRAWGRKMDLKLSKISKLFSISNKMREDRFFPPVGFLSESIKLTQAFSNFLYRTKDSKTRI